MAAPKLIPEKITSPFQLMAAWFAMLVLLVSILLTAAINITTPDWAAGYLVVFTSVLILSVLACVTLMLTIFRPHLQEGKEYAQWLKDKLAYSQGTYETNQRIPKQKLSRKRSDSVAQASSTKNFSINISNATGAQRVLGALLKENFSARIYCPPYREEDPIDDHMTHEAIWVGCDLPVKETIEAIKISVKNWPHLKYIELSNDGTSPPDEIHRELFIGGASSTATEHKLEPWLNDEIFSLDERMSREDFHRCIRRKYPAEASWITQ